MLVVGLWRLLYPRGVMIAALMDNQLGCSPLAIGDEGDLDIHILGEKLMVALGEDFYGWLPGSLCEKTIPVACHGEGEVRTQLIAAHVGIEYFRIDVDFLVFSRRQRSGRALDAGGVMISMLMEDQLGCSPLAIGDESDLDIQFLGEKLMIALREDLYGPLPGSLCEEAIPVPP
jgi:hypothetical protein